MKRIIIFLILLISFQLYSIDSIYVDVDSSSVTITWSPVDGALSYNIYASVKPYSDFQDLTDFGTFNAETSWILPFAGVKMFFYVTSSSKKRKSFTIKNITDKMILEYLIE